MFKKESNEFQVINEMIKTRITRELVKLQRLKDRGFDFTANVGFGNGGGSGGFTGGPGDAYNRLMARVYVTGSPTDNVFDIVVGGGMVFLQPTSEATNGVMIRAEVINDPVYWMGMI